VKSKTTTTIAALVLIGLLAGIILPATKRSNCGGNSYALFACEQYSFLAHLASDDGKSDFAISKLGDAEKSEAVKLAKSHWIGGADFLARTNFTNPTSGRLVIIVCEKPFDNVPQPNVWNFYRRNPAHAVGYSDGSSGLISLAEYSSLDLVNFISLSSIGTNSQSRSVQP